MLVELVEQFDPNLLLKFKLSQSWFSKFLHSMGWVDRAVTKASHKLPDGHVELTETFAMRLAWLVFTYNVRKDMVINLDETGVILVPARSRRLAPQGVKNVACVGNRDRRQVTSTPAAHVLGEKLMLQVIFQGKSVRSLPANQASFPQIRLFNRPFSTMYYSKCTKGGRKAPPLSYPCVPFGGYERVPPKGTLPCVRAMSHFFHSARKFSKVRPL